MSAPRHRVVRRRVARARRFEVGGRVTRRVLRCAAEPPAAGARAVEVLPGVAREADRERGEARVSTTCGRSSRPPSASAASPDVG